MNIPPRAVPSIDDLNAADLLRQGMRTDTNEGELQHLFKSPSPNELAPLFPNLELIELIGEGGMGAVYKAKQTDLDRLVALKILPEEISGEDTFSTQFTREARALAKLNHAHIVTIYEFGKKQELYYIIMEYVDGTSLRKIMEKGLINPQEALAIIPQICDALQYAHDKGIVHRDIKPENILLNREGTVKVVDFGLAKLLPTPQSSVSTISNSPDTAYETIVSRDGKVMGTPAYMPPEQKTLSLKVDHRADIYSLGVVFYQMLTGELPCKPVTSPSRPISKDFQLDKIVQKAMEDNPEQRYQQARIMKTEVEALSRSKVKKIFANTGFMAAAFLSGTVYGGVGAFIIYALKSTETLHILLLLLTAEILISLTIIFFNYKKFIQIMKTNTPKRYIIIALLFGAGVLSATIGTMALALESKPVIKGYISQSAENARMDPSVTSAFSWISLIDKKNYKESYDQLADSVKPMTSLEDWTTSLTQDISPLGKKLSRHWKSTQSQTALPGLPDGEYKILTFESSFEHKKNAIETVTMSKQKDGTWKAMGYFFK